MSAIAAPGPNSDPEVFPAETIEAEVDEEEDQESLKYGAKHVMMLILPVSLCMILVIVTIRVITMYDQSSQPTIYLVYTPFNEQNKKLSTGMLV